MWYAIGGVAIIVLIVLLVRMKKKAG